MNASLPLADLLKQVGRDHDKVAFADLFDYFAPRLKNYLRRLGSTETEAEELVQETMLKVWRRADQFDPTKAAPATWVFAIARNQRLDHMRAGGAMIFDPLDEALVASDTAPDNLDAETVRLALKSLPPPQRELVKMAYFDEQSHGVIAEKLRLPLGTVKSRLRLALEKLRLRLKSSS
jgi:RNA polymerase sigma factor (sigma-70 family)